MRESGQNHGIRIDGPDLNKGNDDDGEGGVPWGSAWALIIAVAALRSELQCAAAFVLGIFSGRSRRQNDEQQHSHTASFDHAAYDAPTYDAPMEFLREHV